MDVRGRFDYSLTPSLLVSNVYRSLIPTARADLKTLTTIKLNTALRGHLVVISEPEVKGGREGNRHARLWVTTLEVELGARLTYKPNPAVRPQSRLVR